MPPEELARALRAGSKLRRLVIVCPRDHRLAAVYAGTDGLWLVTEQSETAPRPVYDRSDPDGFATYERRERATGYSDEREHRMSRAEPFYARLADLGWRRIEAVCRCTRRDLETKWVREQLATGRQRVMIPR